MTAVALTQLRAWVYGLAVFAVIASTQQSSGTVAVSTGAAAALLMMTALLTSRTLAGATILRLAREPLGVTLHDRARRTGVLRQCDPDAAGRPRPRAPGRFPLG